MKKKLLFVVATLNRGGAERSLINLLELIDYDKYDVSLLVFVPGGLLENQVPKSVHIIKQPKELIFLATNSVKDAILNFSFKAFGARMRYVFSHEKGKFGYLDSQAKWKMAYIQGTKMLPGEYDIAVAFMHSLPAYYVIDKVLAKRKILWVHNDYEQLVEGRAFDRLYFEKADAIVTISEQCVESLVKSFPDLNDKFQCIYNLNSVHKIKEKAKAYVPREYIGETRTKILSIGRLNKQKGFDYAIMAAKVLKDHGFSFAWFIIGVGELYAQLQRAICDNNLEDCVYLLGGKENPYPYIKGADIIAQTSRFEGKSIVLDEAKILCKPILTTDYLSVHDQIQDGVTGKIVSFDENEIARGLVQLIENKVFQQKLIDNLCAIPDKTQEELQKYDACFCNSSKGNEN